MLPNRLNLFRPPLFEEVLKARIHAIVHEEIERHLAPKGFSPAGDLKWVGDTDAPIRQVFEFRKWAGKVTPVWGLSLDFVPHISGKKAAWHRTNKSAKLDLCFDPGAGKLDMSCIAGEAPIRKQHKQIIAAAVREADHFWARAAQAGDLPDLIDGLKDHYRTTDGLTFYSYKQHALATAFILRHLGRDAEGLAELDRRHDLFWEPEAWQNIRQLMTTA